MSDQALQASVVLGLEFDYGGKHRHIVICYQRLHSCTKAGCLQCLPLPAAVRLRRKGWQRRGGAGGEEEVEEGGW